MPIYLDNHATTPLDPRVLEAMMPYFTTVFGNASSKHCFGEAARDAVEKARAQVATLLGCLISEVIFTSGATESNNMALRSFARKMSCKGRHIVTSVLEHKAVLDTCHLLEEEGFEVTYLWPNAQGLFTLAQIEAAIRQDTILASFMYVNNEIGTINPIAEIGALCRARGVVFHCDAAQAIGRMPCDVGRLQVDLLSLSGHKIYGPKGVGALYVRQDISKACVPLMCGGGQEYGLRSGTLNVPGIVGLGEACALAHAHQAAESARIRTLRELLLGRLVGGVKGLQVNGCLQKRAAGNLSVFFPRVDAPRFLFSIGEHIAISSSSACSSGKSGQSYVISALGNQLPSNGAIVRFGIGRFNSQDDIEKAAYLCIETWRKQRALSLSNG